MAVDVAPVISALTDAGVAVGAVGACVLLVVVAVKSFQYLRLSLGDVGVTRSMAGDDWEVVGDDGHLYMQGVNDDGSVWEQDLGPGGDSGGFGAGVSGSVSDDGGYGVSQEEFDSWDEDRQNQYEIDRLTHELGDDD